MTEEKPRRKRRTKAEMEAAAKQAGLTQDLPEAPVERRTRGAPKELISAIKTDLKSRRTKKEVIGTHKVVSLFKKEEGTKKCHLYYINNRKFFKWDNRGNLLEALESMFRDFDCRLIEVNLIEGIAIEFVYEPVYEFNFAWTLAENILMALAKKFSCTHADTVVIHSAREVRNFSGMIF